MIKVGSTVAVPWGLDEFPVAVLEMYESGGKIKVRVEFDEPILGPGDNTRIVVPIESVRLLPCKPFGWWLRQAGATG